MTDVRIRALAALFSLALLTGCETAAQNDVAQATVAQADVVADAPVMMSRMLPGSSGKTIAWGQAADWQLSDEQRLVNALNNYGVPRNNEPVRRWIQRIEQNSTKLGGLGGPPARQFLEAAKQMTLPESQGGGYRPVTGNQRVKYTTTGDLIEFDRATGRVVVIMTTLREVPGGQQIPVEAYRWTLTANFSTHIKDLSNAGNVFPGTSLAISAMHAAGFNSKVFAEGPSQIVVDLVERRAGNSQNWQTIQKPHPFYDIDNESCIDIMFAAATPPDSLSDADAPPLYCLGRCSSPPIVNTK